MPVSPSSSAQEARLRLAAQLRDMRKAAGLSGRQFAARAGWADATNVTKIEKGQRTITPEHIRLWCRTCGVSEQRVAELLAEQSVVVRMWVAYTQLNQGGLTRAQQSVREMFERLRLFREYQSRGFPGLLQTEAWTREVLGLVFDEQGVQADDREADVAAAVTERMNRQSVLRRAGKRFVFLMEESAVRYRTMSANTHRAQIKHVLKVMHLPLVSYGVIPMDVERGGMRPREAFTITDSNQVNIELVSGYMTITHPAEVAMYVGVFDRLAALAVYGRRCEAILRAALSDLEA
ncbi:Scr1 family TA system antitoxin-like transcriptional regulator [Streptosporangium saharense]|uniref:Scr1 family TA system antitoxin-like transcriptional regulator n=1 Tax=Streptosporangium saharense TaxID=1706840 RepID=UPI003677E67E